MSVAEVLRLLAVAQMGKGAHESDDVLRWTRVQPGEYLRTTLAAMRNPSGLTRAGAGLD